MITRKEIHSLSLDNISFAYEESALVFENVSIAMPKSRAVWVRSPGGCGKTTFLKILAGLLTPQHGRYLINGENANEMAFEQFLPFRLNMGYGFDYGGLLNNRTLEENLSLPLLYHGLIERDEALERVESMIDRFGMEAVRDQRPFTMPGSQRKLACVVRAFMHWPEVVFLDDPLTGLKQDSLTELIQYVEESFEKRGLKQIFFSSERAYLAEKFKADEVMVSPDYIISRSVA